MPEPRRTETPNLCDLLIFMFQTMIVGRAARMKSLVMSNVLKTCSEM